MLWAGAGLGLALLSRLNNAIVAPFLGLLLVVYLWRQCGRTWRRWVGPLFLYGLPVLAALVVAGWYNWLRFGNPLTTGYLPQERFATPFFEGFYGLTLSPGKGIFWYNPILFAALAGWPMLFRRHRAEAILLAATVLGNVAFYAPWYLWWAGHAWGPRFLVTLLPFAILSLAPVLEAASHRRLLAVALGGLAAASVAVQLLGVSVDFNLYLEEIHAELGLYHPATLFSVTYSPLLRQITYLRLENLDQAWARGGRLEWIALLTGLSLVFLSSLALWGAWRRRLSGWGASMILALLVLGAAVSLLCYAPGGDVSQTARALASMEKPGEAVALIEPVLTEAFQDAYDGRLWIWGVPSWTGVASEHSAIWSAGKGELGAATARFYLGDMRLDYFPQSEMPFDASRLPVDLVDGTARLGDAVELLAVQVDNARIAPGEVLPVVLYWRALAPMDTSYTVFVQVIGEGDNKAGQTDRLPCDGGCPTSTWRAGDLVGERYAVPIDPDASPGRYEIICGMYDLATGDNLTWQDAGGNLVGSYLTLGTVDVQ